MGTTGDSILDHPAISGRYLFPQPRYVDDPFMVEVADVKLACFRRIIDPDKFTMVHFHGNGEAVADYVPNMAEMFADLDLNSLFVEYREYGSSTGLAQLVSMLGDGEAAIKAAETVDSCLQRLIETALAHDYEAVQAMLDKIEHGHLHLSVFGRVSTGK